MNIASSVVITFLTLAALLQGVVAFNELKNKTGHPKIWVTSTVVCIILAVISGYTSYASSSTSPSSSSTTTTPTTISSPTATVGTTPTTTTVSTPTATSPVISTSPPASQMPGGVIQPPLPPVTISSPRCFNASDLQVSQFMVHRCPNGFQAASNPYNDFQAKNEGIALADSGSAILYITGFQALHLKDIPCKLGCLIESDILFHDEPVNFRTSTQMGVFFANHGLAIDRSGNVCEVFQQVSGEYTVTPLKQLPNFPTGSSLTSNENPIKLQIQYVSSKSLTFQVSYDENNGQSQTISLASNFSQDEINLASYNQDTILKIFSQNIVDPKAYQTQFQNNPRDFGDGSIIGVSKLIITPMN
jgi:hypothetical protein